MPREWQSDQRYVERRDPHASQRQHDEDVRIERRDERAYRDVPSAAHRTLSMGSGASRSERMDQGSRQNGAIRCG